jgi:hypothetical protein
VAYIDVQQVRDAGLDDGVADDDVVTAAIAGWQEFIDRATDQFFEPRSATVELDGTDSDTIHFGVPIISITEIKINNSATVLDTSLYKVYNRQEAPNDDRRNPRIKLVRDDDNRDIFSSPIVHGRLLFRKGRQNQEITGSFGFTEVGGGVPFLIQRALLLLVIEKLSNPIIPDPSNPIESTPLRGPILEEVTDGHKLKFQARGGPPKASPKGLRGITENPEILDIIKLYKAPLRMATPANWSYH